ncbi:MAG TPA: response regulator [Oligoflexus sp.]|uniref:response regulator n=1 Tax=Oligoflexus sp. TaxID=1971216 RepID=UPI002D803D49|nr:response regulator [Oligoflexus sp.]HET9238033.1 response regulator [Oligoflexus sp.]
MAPESRRHSAKMALLTEERYVLCPLWRQLVLFWPHELVALNRETTLLLKIFPQLEAIWVKPETDAPFARLLGLVDSLALRDPGCHLIVCLDKATPAEMQELLDHGVDEIVFQAGILAEPQVLLKTRIALNARRVSKDALKAHIVRHQKALQSKTEFLAWLSHEIRTPMNGVLGLLEIFQKDNLTAEQLDMLDVMDRSGRRVVDLLSEVLDVSRMEAGKMNRVTRDFHLRRLIEDSLQLYARDARDRGLLMSSVIEADVPDALRGDERKLSQILNNLISNAVKYTSVGQVLIKVRVEAWEGETCRLLLDVQDTGHGIAAAELDKLFQPFEQTESAHLSRNPSSGLGLSLTRDLVQLLGGSIRVQSQPGVGSTFSCTLPFALQEEALQPEVREPWRHPRSARAYVLRHPQSIRSQTPAPQPEALNFEGARILVVDDDPVNLKVADKQLKKLKAEPTLASSGVDALEWLEKKHFDLIFVDCQMPHMDGFELNRILHTLPHFIPGTPVIALTALGREEDRQKALQHGFTDFLAKPAQLDDIRKLLGRWLTLP